MTTEQRVERVVKFSPEGRPIILDDAEAASFIRSQMSPELSDGAFVNLFLFRHVHGYRIHEAPLLHIRGFAYDGTELVIPLFNVETAPRAALLEILGPARWLYPFGQVEAERFADRFDLSWDESDSDYVYASERLCSLRGLKNRRQQARQFEAMHAERPVVRELGDDETQRAARRILDAWQRDLTGASAETDYAACREALDHQAQLGLFGLLIEAGDEPAGFVLASHLSTRMAAIHFAKGLRQFPGIYAFMFRAFAQAHPGLELINFEQDLGKPGFRQAKQSYQPIYLARKYRMRPRKFGG